MAGARLGRSVLASASGEDPAPRAEIQARRARGCRKLYTLTAKAENRKGKNKKEKTKKI